MTSIAVNAIHSGMQLDGHWAGTPSLIVQLMDHPSACRGATDGAYPMADWDYAEANEVSMTKLLARRTGAVSPHFSQVGAATLTQMIESFRERHVVLTCREPGLWDLTTLIDLLRNSGRSIQIVTAVMTPSLQLRDIWLSLLALPARHPEPDAGRASMWPSEVLASIRWRSDLDRAEALYGRMGMVWLRPSPLAEDGIYRQCIAVATRHLGWRVTRKPAP